ncbi:outer membrane beta-barrel protein [Sphingomonadaceae bacterium G21617-S1]|nr:outer membrane beta-barrel protein [Sphingomonadaceae bacterium G21617-S1]
MTARLRLWAMASAAVFTAPPAQAQLTSDVISIADQPRPEWAPRGIGLGSWIALPSVELGALATTNVRAGDRGARADIAATATADLLLKSDWGRHALSGEAHVRRSRYASFDREGRTEYGAKGIARYDISATDTLGWVGSYDRLAEPREEINAPGDARRPALYDQLRGTLTYARDTNLVQIEARALVDRRHYRAYTSFAGRQVSQAERDFTRYQGSLKLGYALSGSLSAIVAGSFNKRQFDQRSGGGVNRNSRGGTIEGGFLWRPNEHVSIEGRAGYLVQRFKDARLNDAKGLSLNARAIWNVIPRTSFRLEAARRVSESSAPTVEGQLVTTVKAGIDREILPNVVLTAEGSCDRISYIGIPRRATEYRAELRGTYLLSRLTSMTASLQHVQRSATIASDRFSGQRALIGIKFSL